MPPTVLDGLDAVRAAAGTHLGWSDWIEVEDGKIVGYGQEGSGM